MGNFFSRILLSIVFAAVRETDRQKCLEVSSNKSRYYLSFATLQLSRSLFFFWWRGVVAPRQCVTGTWRFGR